MCGLHAGWTEFKGSVPKYINKLEGKRRNRDFLYITILREPGARFVSEFKCYKKGTTWENSLHMCNALLDVQLKKLQILRVHVRPTYFAVHAFCLQAQGHTTLGTTIT